MIRSLLGNLLFALLLFAIFILLPVAIIIIGTALLLGLGMLMASFFPVTTFEGAVIGTAVAFPALWLFVRFVMAPAHVTESEEDDEEEEDDDRFVEPPMVVVSQRLKQMGKNQRKRRK